VFLLLGCVEDAVKQGDDEPADSGAELGFDTGPELETDTDGDGTPDDRDCAPNDAAVHPGAIEICNSLDDDCDGVIDEDAAWYPDVDGDGYGDAAASAVRAGCDDPPPGHVADFTDCDDANAAANPGADEVCDALDVDEDCDGRSDSDDDSTVGMAVYAPDADGDGYGDSAAATSSCDPVAGMVEDATDCNDADPSVHPGADEDGLHLLEDLACDGGGGNLSDADFAFIGERGPDNSGWVVRSAGDVDGDGRDDVLIGAPFNEEGGEEYGKAYLVLGSTIAAHPEDRIDLSQADHAFIAEARYNQLGRGLSGAGDVDGDGLDDILIAAYINSEAGGGAGKSYLILGSTLAAHPEALFDLRDADCAFLGAASGDYAGRSLSSAGDVDGDGLGDIILGAAGTRGDGDDDAIGTAYLVLGSSLAASTASSLNLRDADFSFHGERHQDNAGSRVGSAGDVDGDGLDDLFMASPYSDEAGHNAGKAYVVLASSVAEAASNRIELADADYAIIGEAEDDWAAESIRSAGDVDGDGLDDIILGATGNDEGGYYAGKAYLVLGKSLATAPDGRLELADADFSFPGERRDNRCGRSVSGAGDLDGDGLDDLVIGSTGNDEMGRAEGKVYAILGRTLAASATASIDLATADFAFIGEYNANFAGSSVSDAGDVNGDGLDDILIGATGNDDGGGNAGKTYLLLSHLRTRP
jgi:hypothetical protein